VAAPGGVRILAARRVAERRVAGRHEPGLKSVFLTNDRFPPRILGANLKQTV